jgi:Bystin
METLKHDSCGCRYTTGKLPKAFMVIPHLKNWEAVLFMTCPHTWSPHATLCATKMFVSQLNTKQVQRFLNLILLNKVRDDIRENKRLHFALFQAVKKAVFKAGAFYKGFVLPLLKQGDCTLREAVILSAALNRVSVPMDHSAAVRPASNACVMYYSHSDFLCMFSLLMVCIKVYTAASPSLRRWCSQQQQRALGVLFPVPLQSVQPESLSVLRFLGCGFPLYL